MATATPAVDRRCLRDGAYCTLDDDLFRCLGIRPPAVPGERARVGFENAVDPSDIRWVKPTSLFAQRVRFVTQGDPTTDRETIEAMR